MRPSGGSILVPRSRRRPGFTRLTTRRNQRVIAQLGSTRASQWSVFGVPFDETGVLYSKIQREIEAADLQSGPLFLFPFGPKSLVFPAALYLASEYPEGSWIVYPIPTAYDVG